MATPRRDLQPHARPEAGMDVRQVVLERGGRRPVLRHAPWPARKPHEALVRTLVTGVDGTDEEVVEGGAEFPHGEGFLVLGHECLGEIVETPPERGLEAGDLVVPLVRHGCDQCAPCLRGFSDMCASGDYREHGIKGLHGFMRDVWTDAPETLVKAPRDLGRLLVLTEPLSVALKALDQAKLIQRRIPWFETEGGFLGGRALVAGAGSLGTLAALSLLDEGMDVWVMDRHPADTFVGTLLQRAGATHVHADDLRRVAEPLEGFDLIIEATGAPEVLAEAAFTLAENGILAALGIPGEAPPQRVESADLMRHLVLGNRIVFGSVNSNRTHYEGAFRRLRAFRTRWPRIAEDLLTRLYAPEDAARAFEARGPSFAKKVIVWEAG